MFSRLNHDFVINLECPKTEEQVGYIAYMYKDDMTWEGKGVKT